MSASTELMLTDSDIGKKVYEIEQEIVLVVKTQVIAKDDDEAFNKWLDCSDTRNVELYDVKDNMTDIVNSYFKEYSQLKGTTLIGTVKKEDEQDENSLLEVA
jgi:hypothetical protein